MRRSGAEVAHERAQEIITGPDGVCAVRTRDGEIECRSAVICTGGLSYPGTGSTGDGYRMAAELGHTVTPARPSLVPLESPDGFCRDMQGLSLKNVRLTAYEDGHSEIARRARCCSRISACPGRWCFRPRPICEASLRKNTG